MEYKNTCMGCMGDKGEAQTCPHCGYVEGTVSQNTIYLPPRTMLAGKYLIGRGIGHGGFGITYLAYDTVLKRKLAIKEYMPQDCATRMPGKNEVAPFSSEDKKEQYFYGVDKFLEEARTLAQFDGHPNIVGVRDFFKENGTAYLVMNFLNGETLKEYLRRHDRALSYRQALKIMLPVMDALRTVHAAGVLHRDVSPDNIFLTSVGQVKLIDFGAARQPMGGQRSISVILKPGYAPEEQYRSRGKQGPWTDVYATAATFYRAITGKVPSESLDRMEQDTMIIPTQLGVKIPPDAQRALLKAMSVRASDRYQSIQEFKEALLSEGADITTAPAAQTAFELDAPQQEEELRSVQPRRPEPRIDLPVSGRRPRDAQRQDYDDEQTYPLKHHSGAGKMRVGIVVALLIVLLVVAGALLLLYWLGSEADGVDATPQSSPSVSAQVTASPQGEVVVSPAPSTSSYLTPMPLLSALPSATPEASEVPGNQKPGGKPSASIQSYIPSEPRIITIRDAKGVQRKVLTGKVPGSGLLCEADLDASGNVTGVPHMYYVGENKDVLYAEQGALEQANGSIYLPNNLSVGVIWKFGAGNVTLEVVAVDYTATLSGKKIANCIVAKAGDGKHYFFAPNVGLYAIRPALAVDEGASYQVTDIQETSINLEDLIAVG